MYCAATDERTCKVYSETGREQADEVHNVDEHTEEHHEQQDSGDAEEREGEAQPGHEREEGHSGVAETEEQNATMPGVV